MLRGAEHRNAARHGGARVLQFRRCVGRAAGFAVVTVLIGCATLGALAFDKAIRQEHALFFIIILFDFADLNEAGIPQIAVDGFGALAVFIAMRRVIQIKMDIKTRKVAQVLLMHAGDERLGCDAFLLGTQHDGCTVCVVGTDIRRVIADEFLEADPHIGLDVFNQMAEMDGAVGVGQSGSDE